MLPEVRRLQEKLRLFERDPSKYEDGQGYWDDLCLADLLEGVCMRFIAHPVSVCVV